MDELKVYLPEDLKREFKKRSMESFGYGRGSISKAAEEAIQRWTSERESVAREVSPPRDVVGALRGMLRHLEESSVDLQHGSSRMRAEKASS